MSERIQVKRDGEHRGWVQYVGVDAKTRPDDGRFNPVDLVFEDVWIATISDQRAMKIMRADGTEYESGRYVPTNAMYKYFPSREEAIRWLVEEETA